MLAPVLQRRPPRLNRRRARLRRPPTGLPGGGGLALVLAVAGRSRGGDPGLGGSGNLAENVDDAPDVRGGAMPAVERLPTNVAVVLVDLAHVLAVGHHHVLDTHRVEPR